MSFFKETDYHGSRTYEDEPAVQGFIGRFRLRASLTFAWVRLQIEKFLHLGVAPLHTSSLMHRGEKHFTMLGTRQRAARASRPITDLFPISNSNDRARRIQNDN